MESFAILGDAVPASPVVLSVPHAGRDYPPALLAALRVPFEAVMPLEDRLVDLLATAARGHETMLVARRPRAWIDLNRGEHERDPRVDAGARPTAIHAASTKVRGGLGLVPRRASGSAELWARKWSADAIAARIADDHRPYHAALSAALAAARHRFGVAVLLDIHSMPSLGPGGAAVVLGDRFGRSAGARFVGRLEGIARGRGIASALNSPYAGGHILDRHGAPQRGVHAVQLEIDRTLYLDAAGRTPGDGFARTAAMLRAMIDALADEAMPGRLAAE